MEGRVVVVVEDVVVVVVSHAILAFPVCCNFRAVVFSVAGGCLQRIHGLPEAYLSGFHGCIRYMKVNDEVLDLVKDSEVKGAISFCSTRH